MTTPFCVITNLAYIAAGLYVLRGRRTEIVKSLFRDEGGWLMHPSTFERLAKLRPRTLSSWLVGLSFVALGVASGLHHFFNTTLAPPVVPWAQLADERGMYLAFSVLAGVLWAMAYRLRGGYRTTLVLVGLAQGIVLAAFAAQPWADSMWMMPTLALLCIAGVGVGQSWGRALKFFVAFLAIAAIRERPEANFWARDPLFSYDLIHGAWHLVTGLWMYYLWKSTEQ